MRRFRKLASAYLLCTLASTSIAIALAFQYADASVAYFIESFWHIILSPMFAFTLIAVFDPICWAMPERFHDWIWRNGYVIVVEYDGDTNNRTDMWWESRESYMKRVNRRDGDEAGRA